jgi:arylsulfatase
MWPVGYDGIPVTDTTDRKAKYPPLPLIEGNETVRILKTLEDQAELTGYYTRKGTDFIRKNRKKPFFLYMAHSMPHVPIAASPAFRGKSGAGLYGDVIQEIDASVGAIMKTLDELGMTKNTLVIFTSDNGPWLSFGNHAGNTGGLREGKGSAWDGGMKVPCIMRYPAAIEAGSICNQLVASMDLLPTITNLCKAKLPAKKIDGISLLPLFQKQNPAMVRDELAYYYDRNSLKGIRKGQWKLVFPATSQTYKLASAIGADGFPGKYASTAVALALYDLRTDPGETLDVKEKHPDIVQQLSAIAEKYRDELGDDLVKKVGREVRPAAIVK